MTEFAEVVRADRRLTILKLLEQSDNYSANHYLLHSALPGFAHNCSADAVHTDLEWLAEQGLVTTTEAAGVLVARLTSRGEDAANGRTRVPGVKRPRPE